MALLTKMTMNLIQDLDINTDDRLMVDQTPFRVLLKKDVDLLRDARILEVQEASDLVIVALQGDYGKPRPALIIQRDLFSELSSATVLPMARSSTGRCTKWVGTLTTSTRRPRCC